MFTERGRIPAITGIGAELGRRVVTNTEIFEHLKESPEYLKISFAVFERMMRPVGIQTRHWVDADQATSDLAAEALIGAINMAGIDRSRLRSIVVCTSSPDYLGVPVAPMVLHKLGLSEGVRVYDIAAACTGWAQELYNAFGDLTSPLGRKGPHAVIGAEVTSLSLSTKHPNVYPLFGDAGGAVVVGLVEPDGGAPTSMGFAFGGDGSYAERLYIPAGGSRHPASQATIDGGMHAIHMDGPAIKDAAIRRMVEVTNGALAQAGVPIEEVDLFIPHQANLAIMHAVADELHVPWEKVVVTIYHMGNTSAASIPTALWEAWVTGKINRNDLLAFATFGAGLTYAAGVIPMVGLPRR